MGQRGKTAVFLCWGGSQLWPNGEGEERERKKQTKSDKREREREKEEARERKNRGERKEKEGGMEKERERERGAMFSKKSILASTNCPRSAVGATLYCVPTGRGKKEKVSKKERAWGTEEKEKERKTKREIVRKGERGRRRREEKEREKEKEALWFLRKKNCRLRRPCARTPCFGKNSFSVYFEVFY